MKYYRLLPDGERIGDVVCRSIESYQSEFHVDNEYVLNEGRYISTWDENFVFEYDPNEGTVFSDYITNDLGWILISEKMKRVMQDAGEVSIQFLPVVIKNKETNETHHQYSVLNVTQLTDALDLNNSEYKEFKTTDHTMLLVKKFAILKAKVAGKHVLRLLNQDGPLFCSEAVVSSLTHAGVTGCDFLEVILT